MAELKPCPFCGGEADPAGWMSGDGKTGPACDNCGGSCESIEMWNTRTGAMSLLTGKIENTAAPDLSHYQDHPEELPVVAQMAATLAAALIVSSHMHYTPQGAVLVYRDVFNAMHKPATAP